MKDTTLITGAFLPNASIYSKIESIDPEHLIKDLFDLKSLKNSQPFDHYYEFISEFCSQEHQDKVLNFIIANFNRITSNDCIVWLDPFACYSSNWINEQLKSKVVYVVSHPVQFVNDYMQLDYDLNVNDLLSQKNLRSIHLSENDNELTELLDSSKSVKKGIVLWKTLMRFILNTSQSSHKSIYVEVNNLNFLNSWPSQLSEINGVRNVILVNNFEYDGMLLTQESILEITNETGVIWSSCIELLIHE